MKIYSARLKSKVFRSVLVSSLCLAGILVAVVGGPGSNAQNQNANTSNGNSNTNSNANQASSTTNTNTGTVSNVNPGTAGTASPCPSPASLGEVRVTRAVKIDGSESTVVQLGDDIALEIKNLATLQQMAQCQTPAKHIVLFLGDRPVTGTIPFPKTDPAKPSLIFPLKRTESSRELWTYLLSGAKWSPQEVKVSVGLEDGYAMPSDAKVNLKAIPTGWFLFWAAIFFALLTIFVLVARKSDLLRDSGPQPDGGRKPYSLARTQAAWWFFLTLASYLFIGMITGDFSTTITNTVLALMGISAGTVVSSSFVDANKAATPPAPGAQPAKSPPPPPVNDVWWMDILSDANGVSFHRFQMAAWTLVLGFIFIGQVYQALAMPNFDGTLLTLLGISAGTYLGLKIPEAK